MKILQASIFAELPCVHEMIGRVNGSGTCPVEFQAIDPSVGKALLAAELGIDAKPSLHVRFNHGRSEIAPSVLVNVMSPGRIAGHQCD